MSLKTDSRAIRTGDAARERIRKSGFAPGGHPVWTQREIAILAALFPDYQIIMRALGRRSYYAIRHMARSMRLTQCRHVWTSAEMGKLRRLYPRADRPTLEAAFPGVSIQKIRAQAKCSRIFKIKRPFKPTGFAPIDQIRARAFELNLSMVELDALAGTKTYFQKAFWCANHRVDYRAVGRAAEALDGLVSLHWKDAAD